MNFERQSKLVNIKVIYPKLGLEITIASKKGSD